MTTIVTDPSSPTTPPSPSRADTSPRSFRLQQIVLGAVAIFALVAFVRTVTDANDLTSSGTFGAALRLAVPILLAGLGGLVAERAGIVNIGLEGMMILGTWLAGWAGWHWGPWWALVFGLIGGALGGLLHAVATVSFGVNQIVSGVAINILGVGVTRFLAELVFTGEPGASASQSPPVSGDIGRFNLPLLSGGPLFGWETPDPLGWFERKRWFLVSDVAGLAKGITSNLSLATLVAIAMVPLLAYVLWRTRFGLRLRSSGENPTAADSLGVAVYRVRYIAVSISGALAGLGGAFLVLEASRFREGQTANRGFIGLAALIFGNWRPSGVALGAGLFGFADALQLRSNAAVRALLLFVAIVAGIVLLWVLLRRRWIGAIVLALVSAGFGTYYAITENVPRQFVVMTPYLVTLLVLALASQRLRPPAAEGIPWRKGDQT